MQQYNYIHVTATTSTVGPCYHCTCQIFSLSQNNPPVEESGIRWEENDCLHTRLMACILSLYPSQFLSEQETADLEAINSQKVNDAIRFSDIPVTELPAELNVKKFSVVSNDSVSVISVFKVSATSRKVVQCHNGVCGIAAGNKRAVDTVMTSLGLCEHLKVFRDFVSLEDSIYQMTLFDEDDNADEVETVNLPDDKVT